MNNEGQSSGVAVRCQHCGVSQTFAVGDRVEFSITLGGAEVRASGTVIGFNSDNKLRVDADSPLGGVWTISGDVRRAVDARQDGGGLWFETRRFQDFSEPLRGQLSKLVSVPGLIRYWLELLPGDPSNQMIVSAAFMGDVPVGWAVAFHHEGSHGIGVYDLAVFVHPNFRRTGIGRRVLHRLVFERLSNGRFYYSATAPGAAQLYAPLAKHSRFFKHHW